MSTEEIIPTRAGEEEARLELGRERELLAKQSEELNREREKLEREKNSGVNIQTKPPPPRVWYFPWSSTPPKPENEIELIKRSKLYIIGTKIFYELLTESVGVFLMVILLVTTIFDKKEMKKAVQSMAIVNIFIVVLSSTLSFLKAMRVLYNEGVKLYDWLGVASVIDMLASLLHLASAISMLFLAHEGKRLPNWSRSLLLTSLIVSFVCLVLSIAILLCYNEKSTKRRSIGHKRILRESMNDGINAINKSNTILPIVMESCNRKIVKREKEVEMAMTELEKLEKMKTESLLVIGDNFRGMNTLVI